MSFINPSYLELFYTGELHKRVEKLNAMLRSCRLCPRSCNIDRISGKTGYCRAPANPIVARACLHRGEEPVISGSTGIGNLFFANCNLHCVYCQNYQISQLSPPVIEVHSVDELANLLLHFQNQNCGRIGLVTSVHFLPMIAEALLIAIPRGFHLPLVYNTNAYDSVETLKLLESIVDIYLPDIKYADDTYASKYSDAPHYVKYSRLALREMYRQIGSVLHYTNDCTISRGLIIRHLVLPGQIAGTSSSLEWIATALSPKITISLMAQYYPAYRCADYPELNRFITTNEYQDAIKYLYQYGFENAWIQELYSQDYYRPDFNAALHPFEYKTTKTQL